jgi:hypothetical protein
MERRRDRLIVLVIVVALHLPMLLAIRAAMWTRAGVPEDLQPPLVVEFLLNADPTPRDEAALQIRRTSNEPVSAPKSSQQLPREPTRAQPPRKIVAPTPPQPIIQPQPESQTPTDLRLYAADGSLRVSQHLAQELADEAAAVAAAQDTRQTYHLPEGDNWVMRMPESPIDPGTTIFSEVWKPTDMNPVEEACWRNKGLAFLLSMLGSEDCARPGQKSRRPTPAMIVYGVDDGDEILRKIEDWERYNER